MSGGQMVSYQQKVANVRGLLDRARDQVALALPKHVTPERMLRVCMTAIQRTPKLLDCDPRSLVGAIVEASQLGLEPDGVLGHAYLVPFNNKKTGNIEVQLIAGYKGLVDLARRSGQVSEVYAFVVHEADEFDYQLGLEPSIRHRPADVEEPGPLIAVYAVAKFRDGGRQFEVMRRREIDAIRKRSRAGTSGPWVTDYEEMAKKTVLRRLCKLLPVSVELQKVVALDEHAEAGIPQQLASAIAWPALPPAEDSGNTRSLDMLADTMQGNASDDTTPPDADNGTIDAEFDEQAASLDEWHQALSDCDTLKAVAELRMQAQSTLQGELLTQVLAMCSEKESGIRSGRGSATNSR